MGKKKGKPMSASLKRFLKKYGRFPKKGELKRMNKRGRSSKPKKTKSRARSSSRKQSSQTRRHHLW